MKKFALLISSLSLTVSAFATDLNSTLPETSVAAAHGYEQVSGVAQYGDGDWSQAVAIARCISMEEACAIADSNPEISYFFYTTGLQMVLGNPESDYRVFHLGDVVFFSGTPHWGEAQGLADGYIKTKS